MIDFSPVSGWDGHPGNECGLIGFLGFVRLLGGRIVQTPGGAFQRVLSACVCGREGFKPQVNLIGFPLRGIEYFLPPNPGTGRYFP